MTLIEKAVLSDRPHFLEKRNPVPTGWQQTKSGGYHYVRRDHTMTVKQAISDKWSLTIRWFRVSGMTLPMRPNDKEINTDPMNTLRCLSSFDPWHYLKKLNILKVIKALKKIKVLKEFMSINAVNISRQPTSGWLKGLVSNSNFSPSGPLFRCKSMSINLTFRTAGGRITCIQCNAL